MTESLDLATAQTLLDDLFAPWVKALQLRLESVSPDGVSMRLPFSEELCRVGGIVCGQALMALADTCMVFTVSAALGSYRGMSTVTQTSSFFRPASGSDVIARGRVLKQGRNLVFGEVTLYPDGDERPIAHATSTYAIAP